MKKFVFKYLLTLALFVGLIGGGVLAASAPTVEIVEIAWSGTSASWADEWIELRNPTEEEVDLTGWSLSWEGVRIPLGEATKSTVEVNNSVIGPGEVFLLERTDDETVSSIKADVIFKGSLSNSGEKLVLKDDEGNELEVVDATEGWLAGTSSDGEPGYASMELLNGEWRTHEEPGEQKDANENPIYGSPGEPSEEVE
ncbi:MAG: lamin tail domain-containing protein [Candidatus Bipolaricaulota bacterium]